MNFETENKVNAPGTLCALASSHGPFGGALCACPETVCTPRSASRALCAGHGVVCVCHPSHRQRRSRSIPSSRPVSAVSSNAAQTRVMTRPSCCSFCCGALHVPAHTLRRWRLDFDPVSVRSTPSTHIPSHAVCACHGPIGSHSLSCALVKLLAFKQSLASPSSYSVSSSRGAHRAHVMWHFGPHTSHTRTVARVEPVPEGPSETSALFAPLRP